MKKVILSFALVLSVAYAASFKKPLVLIAQTIPYPLVVAWDASADATRYNCYLDGVLAATTGSLTCSFNVNTLGNHVVGVSALNDTFVPAESAQTTLAFKLQQPGKPANIKVK